MTYFRLYICIALLLSGCIAQKNQQIVQGEDVLGRSPSKDRTVETDKTFSHRQSIKSIELNNRLIGTCFSIKRPRDGKIILLTADHTVRALTPQQIAQLTIGTEKRKIIKIVHSESKIDIAALEIADSSGLVPFNLGKIDEFETVSCELYGDMSFIKSTKYILAKGYFLFHEGIDDDYFALNLFYAGGSGAPILTQQGKVCSMATQRGTLGNDIYIGVTHAISSDAISQFLHSL